MDGVVAAVVVATISRLADIYSRDWRYAREKEEKEREEKKKSKEKKNVAGARGSKKKKHGARIGESKTRSKKKKRDSQNTGLAARLRTHNTLYHRPAREHGSQRSSPGSSRIQRDDPCVPRVHVPKVSPPSPVGRLQTCAPAKIRERRKKRREIGQASRGWTMSVARTSLSLSLVPSHSRSSVFLSSCDSLFLPFTVFFSFLFLPCAYSSASVHRLFSTSLTFSLLPVSPLLLSRVLFVFFFPFVSFPLENHQLAACTFDVARRQRAEYRKRPARRVRARRKGKGKRARVP